MGLGRTGPSPPAWSLYAREGYVSLTFWIGQSSGPDRSALLTPTKRPKQYYDHPPRPSGTNGLKRDYRAVLPDTHLEMTTASSLASRRRAERASRARRGVYGEASLPPFRAVPV